MRAVALVAPGTVSVVDAAEPNVGPHEVLVRIRGVGLCGSDMAVYRGMRQPPGLPWILGHEGGGRVVAVGSEVTALEVGQNVVVEPDYCCLECKACRAGLTSACSDRIAVGLGVPGLLSEYVAVPAEFAWPVDSSISLADMVCVEPATVARAAIRRSGISSGQECLVIGAGSQGLLLCQALLARGVRVYVTDPHRGRLERACELGAEELTATVGGLRYAFEASGADAVLAAALPRLAAPATVVLIGLATTPLGISARDIAAGHLTLIGSMVYDHPGDFAATVEDVAAARSTPGAVVSERYGLTDAAAAFAATTRASGKVLIEFPDC
jgi:alcohol dehydrogenase/L-iditol 2-dehydrogenase